MAAECTMIIPCQRPFRGACLYMICGTRQGICHRKPVAMTMQQGCGQYDRQYQLQKKCSDKNPALCIAYKLQHCCNIKAIYLSLKKNSLVDGRHTAGSRKDAHRSTGDQSAPGNPLPMRVRQAELLLSAGSCSTSGSRKRICQHLHHPHRWWL